jgi:hypothetical protein
MLAPVFHGGVVWAAHPPGAWAAVALALPLAAHALLIVRCADTLGASDRDGIPRWVTVAVARARPAVRQAYHSIRNEALVVPMGGSVPTGNDYRINDAAFLRRWQAIGVSSREALLIADTLLTVRTYFFDRGRLRSALASVREGARLARSASIGTKSMFSVKDVISSSGAKIRSSLCAIDSRERLLRERFEELCRCPVSMY